MPRGGFTSREAAAAALEELASTAVSPEPGLATGEWLEASTGSGLPSVTLHGAATLALAAGADLEVVQDQPATPRSR